MASKSISSGKLVLDIATNIATCVFNNGFSSILHVIDIMGMTIGRNSYNLCMEVDAERIKRAEKSLIEGARQVRIDSEVLTKEKENEDINLDGRLYGSGSADQRYMRI